MVEDMLKFKRLDGAEEALAILRDRLLAGEDAARLAQDMGAIGAATVIVSEGDRIVGVPDERALPSRFEIVRIAGAGHMPHLEKSAEVNAILGALSD